MNHRNLALLLPLLALAACSEPAPKIPRISEALPHMPLPPNPAFVSKSGSADALQVVVSTPFTPAQTLAYYRKVLGKPPWRLISDQPMDSTGRRALYAERDGPPLWVTIEPSSKDTGSIVSLAGAVVRKDSAAVKPTGAPAPAAASGRPAAGDTARKH